MGSVCFFFECTGYSLFMGSLRQGNQKLRELEEILEGLGSFNENFSLGDAFEVTDDAMDEGGGNGPPTPALPDDTAPKKKGVAFPDIEGEESVQDFLAKYKRGLLGRRSSYKDILSKWTEASPATGAYLGCHH